jgi:hypothetical protein
VLDDCLASNRRIEWADDDLPEATALLLVLGWQPGWRARALGIARMLPVHSRPGRDLGSSSRQTWKHLLALGELEHLAEKPAHLLGRLEGRSRRRCQLIMGEPLCNWCKQCVHSLLDGSPLRPVARKIALVHRQRDRRQVNLADEASHARHLDRVGVAEKLAAGNQPAEFVTTQAGHLVDTAAFGLGEAIPTPDGRACSADGKAVLLLEVDRWRLDANAVD